LCGLCNPQPAHPYVAALAVKAYFPTLHDCCV
jgi:hypothetical protein